MAFKLIYHRIHINITITFSEIALASECVSPINLNVSKCFKYQKMCDLPESGN